MHFCVQNDSYPCLPTKGHVFLTFCRRQQMKRNDMYSSQSQKTDFFCFSYFLLGQRDLHG